MNTNIITFNSFAGIILGGTFITANIQLNNYKDIAQKVIKYDTEERSEQHMEVFSLLNDISYNKAAESDKQVVTKFVKSILTECKSLTPEISKLIDENFWDLI